jgi:stearoyl-CoA desaturase (Delta-9 desaturase)
MTYIIIFFVTHWYLSLAAQTLFLHRYAAHGYFQLSDRGEKVAYWLNLIFQGSSYLSPYAYGILHKAHHSYSDTEKDPHSPNQHTSPISMMIHTAKEYIAIYNHDHSLNKVFTPHVKEWKKFDRIASSWPVRIMFGAAYFAFYYKFAPHWAFYLLLPIHFVMGPIHGLIVNWCGHKYGYRNKNTPDLSTNTLPVDLFLMGELYQNNHHGFPNDMKFSKKWWEVDLGYCCLRLFGLTQEKAEHYSSNTIPDKTQATSAG